MPDSKITALASTGTGTDPANDPLVIVDISDTTMSASGTTKKVTLNQLLACSPTATLASATITGDLTVDTNVLKVDSTSNRVGVNNASPSEALDVSGNGFFRGDVSLFNSAGGAVVSKSLIFGSAANPVCASIYSLTASATAGQLYFATETGGVMTDRLQISDTGVFSFLNVGGVAGTAMTLNSTGLGVGVTPSAGRGAIQLSAGVGFPATQVASSDANTLDDYKESAFTPTIEGGTTAGTGTYTTQVGRFTKVGNLVTVQIILSWTAHTGTGNISVANLPYTSSSVTALVGSATIGYVDGLALTAGHTPLAYIQNNSSKIQLLQTPSGGGAIALVPMDTAATIVITATYMV
jgi:hypothetical protein